jgi:hypothetical protein
VCLGLVRKFRDFSSSPFRDLVLVFCVFSYLVSCFVVVEKVYFWCFRAVQFLPRFRV